jgi:hypothetical protein
MVETCHCQLWEMVNSSTLGVRSAESQNCGKIKIQTPSFDHQFLPAIVANLL